MRGGSVQRPLLIASVIAILAATLFPVAGAESERFIACVVCGERGIADALVNIILFLPFGAALAAGGVSLPRCGLPAALLSASVEFAQLWIPGPAPILRDVACNPLGGRPAHG